MAIEKKKLSFGVFIEWMAWASILIFCACPWWFFVNFINTPEISRYGTSYSGKYPIIVMVADIIPLIVSVVGIALKYSLRPKFETTFFYRYRWFFVGGVIFFMIFLPLMIMRLKVLSHGG